MNTEFSVKKCGKNIENLMCVTENVKTFEKLEISFSVSALSGNFYDESENAVDARFTHSDGTAFTVPGFYYEPYDFADTGELIGHSAEKGTWRIRSMFRKGGMWTMDLTVTHNGELIDTANCTFNIEQGENQRGIIAVEPTVKRNFIFENGELYIPIGENVCWHKPILPIFP